MVSQELLNLLVCPETRQPLHLADPPALERLNAAIKGQGLSNRGGSPVREPLEAALIREDGRFAYPVRNDIPVMLIEESLPLAG